MRLAIRDDDTGFFTAAEELPEAYGRLWGEVPLSLAIIPYEVQSHHRGNPAEFFQEAAPVSLADNRALLRLLCQGVRRRRLDPMLHGFHHAYQPTRPGAYDPRFWRPEFSCGSGMKQKLLAGRDLLQRLLGAPVRVFVPPSNALSARGLRALGAAGLDLGCALSARRLLRAHPLNALLEIRNRAHPAYPYAVRRYLGHRQVACHALTPSCDWERLLARLEECDRRRGTFVVATHYWELGRQHIGQGAAVRELLAEVLARARARRAELVFVGDVLAEES